MNRSRLIGIFWCWVVVPALIFAHDAALAHGVSVFAWVDGDTVHTESKFSGGRLAKGAAIEVYDQAGQKLLEGKTDDNGAFSFKLPKKEELKIVLIAGMGHRSEWTLTAQDFGDASPAPPESPPSIPAPGSAVEKPAGAASPDYAQMQALLEQSLDKKLSPILRQLSHLAEKRQSISPADIFGGLGYILGLMGLAAYIHYRRR